MNPFGFPSTEMSKASVKYLSEKGLLRASQEENWEENMSARSFLEFILEVFPEG